MSAITVKPAKSRAEQRDFTMLPWRLYADEPNWIPPLRANQAELVGFRPHPFHQENPLQAFVAYRDGEACGRIVALVNHAHNERSNERRGFFGFFESVDDQAVADHLLAMARQWLADQGMTSLRGPMNPSMNYECGLLIDGFQKPPTFMTTYNLPYYQALLENNGLEKTHDMYAFYARRNMIDGMDDKLRFVYNEALRRFDVTLRPMDRSRFRQEIRMFLDIYNRSMEGSWGFTPMSEAEIDHTANSLRYLIEPELTSVAEVDGKTVGAMFGLLDYNPRIKQINGRLFPFGFIRLLYRRRTIPRMRLISTNVLPEYQKWGIGVLMAGRLLPVGIKLGLQEAEFSWVLESNHLSYKTLKRGGALQEKTWRVYDGTI